jgi:hypothetical protein
MESFFSSEKWQDVISSDRLLHQAVNRSLDLTIERLGRTKFRENLHKLQIMKREMDEACLKEVRLPCNAPLVKQGDRPRRETDCLHGDVGCGFQCMDLLVKTTESNLTSEY